MPERQARAPARRVAHPCGDRTAGSPSARRARARRRAVRGSDASVTRTRVPGSSAGGRAAPRRVASRRGRRARPRAARPRCPCRVAGRARARTRAAAAGRAARRRRAPPRAARRRGPRRWRGRSPRCADRCTNSTMGTLSSMSARTAPSPRCRRRSHGSRPSGPVATYVCALKRFASAKARSAAFWPAASGSNVKTTSPAVESSPMTRRSTVMWSEPKAVPHVAIAVVMPARWQAMTSV